MKHAMPNDTRTLNTQRHFVKFQINKSMIK